MNEPTRTVNLQWKDRGHGMKVTPYGPIYFIVAESTRFVDGDIELYYSAEYRHNRSWSFEPEADRWDDWVDDPADPHWAYHRDVYLGRYDTEEEATLAAEAAAEALVNSDPQARAALRATERANAPQPVLRQPVGV